MFHVKHDASRLGVRSATVRYGKRVALDSVSLCFAPGQIVALLGPNGAGKSTLLAALSGTQPLTAGDVFLGDRRIEHSGAAARAQQIAFVPQATPAPFAYTAQEMVALGAACAPQPERALPDALAALGLTALKDRRLTALSGGERQRCAIARALAQQTPWLLLDEPAAHLDLRYQRQLIQVLSARARSTHVGVIAVIHDLNLALSLADRLILLHGGTVAADGPPESVVDGGRLSTVYETEIRFRRDPDGRLMADPFLGTD
jgi:iron complex transport system ATP-binding protein